MTFQVAALSQSSKVCNSRARSKTTLQQNDPIQIISFFFGVGLSFNSTTYRNQRCFSSHPQHKLFLKILASLVKNRLCSDWVDHAPPESVLRVLICLRLLIREQHYQVKLITDKVVTLVTLLSARDSSVLLGALLALTSLAESSECKEKIGELSVVDNLLVILQEYDILSKRMAAELLRLLCPVRQVREQIRECGGLPVLLSLLHEEHLKLLWSIVWVLVQLCEEAEASTEIRMWGGVQQLRRHYRGGECRLCQSLALSSANVAGRIRRWHISEDLNPPEDVENIMSLQSACCAALTELVLDDTTALHVVQENGVYVIAKLILPPSSYSGPKATSLQCYAFRTLRFLFSMERNRHLFKRLFPTDLFEMFIDVGHYMRDITAYEALQAKVSLYTEEMDRLRESIQAVDQNRPPLRVINGYSILDHLGTGAFGSVFKMTHPNVVKYYKTFLENDRLYIVMELIEGVPLADHFNSLKEKEQQFTEDRLWNIFIQMCLALRYLHKEKRIVHRDLTPNNIILGERDKVTITDFGLAKQKQESSKLTSVVGTILYSCPEIVKCEPYGEKADVWAVGCILYQMATLKPPFYSGNMLSLVTKIVEAVYEPVAEDLFSDRVTDMIQWCLTPDADMRPDIVEVSSKISDIIMRFMDSLYISQHALERRAERDRKRAQKYFLERHRDHVKSPLTTESKVPHSSLGHSSNQTLISGKALLPYFVLLVSLGKMCCYADHMFLTDNVSDEDTDVLDTNSSTASDHKDSGECILKIYSYCLIICACLYFIVSAGICVSQRKVRQIDDPVQRILVQLHKIIYITQLPPAVQHCVKRRSIERFKKFLFDYRSSPYNLKVELNKLLQGSPELMELGSPSSDWWSLVQPFGGDPLGADRPGTHILYVQYRCWS
uniref:Protein kinase domain-containing protein n=1 Tax=Esox lucius TaxID=8010 RepID=A0AAY5L177_ESOLU